MAPVITRKSFKMILYFNFQFTGVRFPFKTFYAPKMGINPSVSRNIQVIIQHVLLLIKITITTENTYKLTRNTLTWLLVIWLWFTNPTVGFHYFGLLSVPLKFGDDRRRSHRWSSVWLLKIQLSLIINLELEFTYSEPINEFYVSNYLKRVIYLIIGSPDWSEWSRMHESTISRVAQNKIPLLLHKLHTSRPGFASIPPFLRTIFGVS